jgi:hypothetical protein
LRRQLAGTPRFASIEVAAEPARLTGLIADPAAGPAGTIEIADGTSVRVNTDVDELAPRRVLGVLCG